MADHGMRMVNGELRVRQRALRSDAARTRERIVEVARRLSKDTGALVPMEHIADAAGIGKPSVYRAFPTRDALMTEVARQQLAEVADLARAALRRRDPGDSFITWMYTLWDYNQRNRLYLEMFDRTNLPLIIEARDSAREPQRQVFDQAQNDNVVRSDVTFEDMLYLSGSGSSWLTLRGAQPDEWQRRADFALKALGVTDELINSARAKRLKRAFLLRTD